jgi:hypothetical protein
MPENITPSVDRGGRTYVPTRSYDLKIVIDDLDYTQDAILVRFVSSLTTAYQSVDMVLELDPNDIILKQLYGGSAIKLAITLQAEDQYPAERIDLDLMFTKGSFQLNEKDQITEGKQKDRGYYSISTVVRDSYKVMNTLVNNVFLGTNVNSIVTQLASMAGASKVEFDSDGRNSNAIDQVCIPPTTFYKVIKEYNSDSINPFDGFIDQRFGLFDGVPGIFCQYDKTLYIKNLTAKMKKNPAFIIYQVASDMDLNIWDLILDEVSKDNTFYTYTTVHTDYAGNAKFAKIGSTIKHIVKPSDTLSTTIEQDLKSVAGDYSIIYKNKTIDVDDAALRTRYFIQDTGDEKNETIFNSRISRRVADLSTLTIDIERNLPVLNLIQVGECVKFKPMTTEYSDLEGKYILWSTDIWFRRQNNWQTTAQVKLMRTNKRAGDTVKPKADASVLPELQAEERALERTARRTNRTVAQVRTASEAAQKFAEESIQQVTQRTGQIASPFQETSQDVRDEIKANMKTIRYYESENVKCESALLGTSTPGCSRSEVSFRLREITRLQKRNEFLASNRSFTLTRNSS